MDDAKWFSERIAQLRMQKGVSAREMSLSLGQGESYVNKIENRRAYPSMTLFFYICEYFGITPREFFDPGLTAPSQVKALEANFQRLSPTQAEHILRLIEDLTGT